MPFDKQILVLAEDPSVRKTQKLVLESLGFNVIAVGTLREVDYVASRSVFDLVILGRAVTVPNKRHAATILRQKLPKTRILEICDHSACVDDPDYVLQGNDPEHLADMVRSIFEKKQAAD